MERSHTNFRHVLRVGQQTDPEYNGRSSVAEYMDMDCCRRSWRKEGGTQAAAPAQPQNVVTVEHGNSLTEKMEWLSVFAQSNTNYIVEVNADENIGNQNLTFSGKNNITITLRGVGANRTLSSSSIGSMFTVSSSITLVLDNNITLRGGESNSSAVRVGGTLVMNNGATITGHTAYYDSYYRRSYGVVYVLDGGTFTMEGGEISGNRAAYGGGVHVEDGTFTMNGGTISRNSTSLTSGGGGGVYVSGGTFTMSGGNISGNTSFHANWNQDHGGGVYVSYGTFTMSGGTISNNTASEGGGVYVGGGTFTMSGGTISGNTDSRGGGVTVGGGTFTINNSVILYRV